MTFLYKLHHSQKSPSQEVPVGTAPLAIGSAVGPGEPSEVKEPQGQPAKPSTSAQPADELRHPVTGELVQPGSPMALLLAARQRAQKGRPGGLALGRSSLSGSLRGHSSQPQAGSDSIFHNEGRPNSFTVVPKLPKEPEKDAQLSLSAQATIPSQWKSQPRRDPEGTEPSLRHNGTKAEPQAPVAWERPASSKLPQGSLLPKSFSSPPSPSCKRDDDDDDEGEFHFEVIPPPPEFSIGEGRASRPHEVPPGACLLPRLGLPGPLHAPHILAGSPPGSCPHSHTSARPRAGVLQWVRTGGSQADQASACIPGFEPGLGLPGLGNARVPRHYGGACPVG